MIQQGARVTIGNEKDVKIWKERWIGSAPAEKITIAKLTAGRDFGYLSENMKVSELIDLRSSTNYSLQRLETRCSELDL